MAMPNIIDCFNFVERNGHSEGLSTCTFKCTCLESEFIDTAEHAGVSTEDAGVTAEHAGVRAEATDVSTEHAGVSA